jgi:F0F1-type ATP synthase assembly protein I
VTENPDDRDAIAQAWAWSSRIISVALEMALPGVLGYWLDQKLGSVVVFLVLGVILGMTGGLYHLIKMVQPPKPQGPAEKTRSDEEARNRR